VPAVRRAYEYARRNPWKREEWIIAYDACPKEKQRYGPEAPFVREVADLLGRTPAAVSRAFGNLWAAQTGGRSGLKHFSHVAKEVIDEYQNDFHRLHTEAQRLRALRIPECLTPRIEVQVEADQTPLPEDVVHQAAASAGLPPELYFVSTRTGTVIVDVGVLLDFLLVGTTGWLAITNTVQLVRDYLSRQRGEEYPVVITQTNSTWSDIAVGRTVRVEERVIRFHLPGLPAAAMPPESRSRLAGFLSFVKGVHRRPTHRARAGRVSAQTALTLGRPYTRHGLERLLKIDLSGVPDDSVKLLSDLVKRARTVHFDAALRTTRRASRRGHR
jgi:hypothetical protein